MMSGKLNSRLKVRSSHRKQKYMLFESWLSEWKKGAARALTGTDSVERVQTVQNYAGGQNKGLPPFGTQTVLKTKRFE